MGLLPLDRETDAVFTGLSVAAIVCVVSSLLYFMFKRSALAPSPDIPIHDPASLKKRSKKLESKKTNKPKKQSHLATSNATELSAEKNKTTYHEGDGDIYLNEATSEDSVSCAGSDQSSIDKNLGIELVEQNNDLVELKYCAYGFEPVGTESTLNDELVMITDETGALIDRNSPDKHTDANLRTLVTPLLEEHTEEPLEFSQVPVKTGAKSKRAKRRIAKQQITNKPFGETVEFLHGNADTVVKLDDAYPPTVHPIKADDASIVTLTSTVKHLEDQLKHSEQKLDAASKTVIQLTAENEELLSKDEANKLGFDVLQQEYTQLLRTNKSIEHERMLTETKLKTLEREKESLTNHLEQINANSLRSKTEADMELCCIRKELSEAQSKITSMAAALSAATAPQPQRGPSPDAVRAQELTQIANLSKDNRLLNSRLEQFEAELNQLRQTNVIQQQELQAFRAENRKLQEDKEAALEEMRTQLQKQNVDAASRIATYEAKIQRSHREVELEKQRQQDCLVQLNDVRTELKHSFDREKRQSDLIDSLEHQFNELNAQKLRLVDEVSNVKTISELSAGELHAQVLSLNNELQRTTVDLFAARNAVDKLTTELENLKHPSIPPTDAVVQAAPEPTEMHVQTPAGWEQSMDADHKIVKKLQEKLADAESELRQFTAHFDGVKAQNLTLHTELERYKSTLVETEMLLAKLQDSVELTENKWSSLLSASEAKREDVEAELSAYRAQVNELSKRAKISEAALKKMMIASSKPQAKQYVTYSSRIDSAHDTIDDVCSKVDDASVQAQQSVQKDLYQQAADSHTESSQNSGDIVVLRDTDTPQPLAVQDSDTDFDFDAVLVDDTDIHLPDDIWDSTANRFSENFSTEAERGDMSDRCERTVDSDSPVLFDDSPEPVG